MMKNYFDELEQRTPWNPVCYWRVTTFKGGILMELIVAEPQKLRSSFLVKDLHYKWLYQSQ